VTGTYIQYRKLGRLIAFPHTIVQVNRFIFFQGHFPQPFSKGTRLQDHPGKSFRQWYGRYCAEWIGIFNGNNNGGGVFLTRKQKEGTITEDWQNN
jgi:hypothetical protein